MLSPNKKLLRKEADQWVSGSVGQWVSSTPGNSSNEPLIMAPRQQPETNDNQHKRFAQHNGPPRRGAPGRRRQKSFITALLLLILVMVLPAFAQTDDIKHYLLMEEIQDALKNVGLFKSISETKISVNLEAPFLLHGYFPIDKFIDDFTLVFSGFETQGIEWVSIQLEEQFTVQSLALVLKDKRSEKTVYYKLIFFLTKEDNEWKIYYLRGLKI